MGLKFEPLGKYVRLVDERNTNLITESVLGINIDKYFMPSVANVIGTDLSNYKLLRKGRFACNPMHVGRDGRLPVARYTNDVPAIVSPAYFMFEVVDESIIEPEFLMICFQRSNFDRMCWFRTDASVRAGITWEDVCALLIPIVDVREQRRLVHDYKVVTKRIDLLSQLNKKIDSFLDFLFKEWFIDHSPFERESAGMPLDWKVQPLSDVLDTDTSSTDPQKMNEERVWHYSIPAFDSDGLPSFDNPKDILSNKYYVPENAILVSKLNPDTKRVWITDSRYKNAICSTEFIIFIPKILRHKSFYYCLFNSRQFTDFLVSNASGSTNSRIRVKPSSALDYTLPLPANNSIIDEFCFLVDPFIKRVQENVREIYQLKSILPIMVEKELFVSDKGA